MSAWERCEHALRIGSMYTPGVTIQSVVWLADSLCRALRLGDSGDHFLEPLPHEFFERLGIKEQLSAEFLNETIAEINESWELLGEGKEKAQVPGGDPDGVVSLFKDLRDEANLRYIGILLHWGGLTGRIQAARRTLRFDQHIDQALYAMEEDVLYIVT